MGEWAPLCVLFSLTVSALLVHGGTVEIDEKDLKSVLEDKYFDNLLKSQAREDWLRPEYKSIARYYTNSLKKNTKHLFPDNEKKHLNNDEIKTLLTDGSILAKIPPLATIKTVSSTKGSNTSLLDMEEYDFSDLDLNNFPEFASLLERHSKFQRRSKSKHKRRSRHKRLHRRFMPSGMLMSGRQVRDIEDCIACQMIWHTVEAKIGTTQMEEDVYYAFRDVANEAEQTAIFYPMAEEMKENLYGMIKDYLKGKVVDDMCYNVGTCKMDSGSAMKSMIG
mmetsp:Transcript_20837/g.37129  ORF Transcript_20837/g.37129 Transcript_20837/m.37129 type:complete len:278 (-) Transcript_20837:206-1039(-)